MSKWGLLWPHTIIFFFNFQSVCLTFLVECKKYSNLDNWMALVVLLMVVCVFLCVHIRVFFFHLSKVRMNIKRRCSFVHTAFLDGTIIRHYTGWSQSILKFMTQSFAISWNAFLSFFFLFFYVALCCQWCKNVF